MREVCSTLAPKNLTIDQMVVWKNKSLELMSRIALVFSSQVMIFERNPENKRQSEEWHTASSPRSKKVRMTKLKIKSMLFCFLSWQMGRNLSHQDILPTNKFFYKDVLESTSTLLDLCIRGYHKFSNNSLNLVTIFRWSQNTTFGLPRHDVSKYVVVMKMFLF